MKTEANRTAPASCCLTAPFDRGLRGYLGCSVGKLSSISAIRVIRGSILSLVAIVSFFPFLKSANAQALANAPAVTSIDGLDCITADYVDEGSVAVTDASSDSPNDLDEISNEAEDKAILPSRRVQSAPQFAAVAGINAAVAPRPLPGPGLLPSNFLLLNSSFFLVSAERAPPSLT